MSGTPAGDAEALRSTFLGSATSCGGNMSGGSTKELASTVANGQPPTTGRLECLGNDPDGLRSEALRAWVIR
eukprot:NODE_28753_length_467_cov_2.120588.p4 GENE.NODE_28753_length_467_cov_2.120588~~NODE_28753_length_467_cov_2.120588.p4  ORF type:complete len:72 (-),score=16.05 NODE_28753_length_467_cov_2.120588:251-466(-)